MPPFEALYDRKCKSPLCQDEVSERRLLGPDILVHTTDKDRIICDHLRAKQSLQKSLVDSSRKQLEFRVGECVFLKISSTKGIIRFDVCGKLSSRYIGPFVILHRVREVAYQLALPPSQEGVHNTYHNSEDMSGMRVTYWITQNQNCDQTYHILNNRWLYWIEVSRF